MLVAPVTLIANAPLVSGIITKPLPLVEIWSFSIQCVYTGLTVSGFVKLQASIDHKQDTQGNILFEGNWDDIPISVTTITGAGVGIYNSDSVPGYPWIRLVYIDSGSSNDAVMTITSYVRGA